MIAWVFPRIKSFSKKNEKLYLNRVGYILKDNEFIFNDFNWFCPIEACFFGIENQNRRNLFTRKLVRKVIAPHYGLEKLEIANN